MSEQLPIVKAGEEIAIQFNTIRPQFYRLKNPEQLAQQLGQGLLFQKDEGNKQPPLFTLKPGKTADLIIEGMGTIRLSSPNLLRQLCAQPRYEYLEKTREKTDQAFYVFSEKISEIFSKMIDLMAEIVQMRGRNFDLILKTSGISKRRYSDMNICDYIIELAIIAKDKKLIHVAVNCGDRISVFEYTCFLIIRDFLTKRYANRPVDIDEFAQKNILNTNSFEKKCVNIQFTNDHSSVFKDVIARYSLSLGTEDIERKLKKQIIDESYIARDHTLYYHIIEEQEESIWRMAQEYENLLAIKK